MPLEAFCHVVFRESLTDASIFSITNSSAGVMPLTTVRRQDTMSFEHAGSVAHSQFNWPIFLDVGGRLWCGGPTVQIRKSMYLDFRRDSR